MEQAEANLNEPIRQNVEKPQGVQAIVRAAAHATDSKPVRRLALYVGLAVVLCQLIFVYAFFRSFEDASKQLAERHASAPIGPHKLVMPAESKYSRPDLLQWAGARSLTWIASLFAPDTSVRFAPALIFFLVTGGFLAAMYRRAQPGSMINTVAMAARTSMRVWLSWFAGAFILLMYIVTSSGGMEALRVSAGITFEKPWKDISDAFLSHWLGYVAWFVLLGLLPMAGGGILGLLRTHFLTPTVMQEDEAQQQIPEMVASGSDCRKVACEMPRAGRIQGARKEAEIMVVGKNMTIKHQGNRLSYHDAARIAEHALTGGPVRTVLIDLEQTHETTTAALARLVVLRRHLLNSGRDLCILGLRGRAKVLYELCHLTNLLPQEQAMNL